MPLMLALSVEMAQLDVLILADAAVDARIDLESRHFALLARNVGIDMRCESEASLPALGRLPCARTHLGIRSELISLADVGRRVPRGVLKRVAAIPPLELEVRIFKPPTGLPQWCEELKVSLLPGASGTDPVLTACLDTALLEAAQTIGTAIVAELEAEQMQAVGRVKGPAGCADSDAADRKMTQSLASALEEFQYIYVAKLHVSPLPLCIDAQLEKPVFLSFTGLSITLPKVQLSSIATPGFILRQELLAHCIALGLLNSPVILGSCDLLGNPALMYKHLRSGLGDLLQQPLREGFNSFGRHVASASLLSVSAVSDSIRRNLPIPAGALPPPAASSGQVGLTAGLRAFAGGVGRGLSGVVDWEQHTPNREGFFGRLRGARNAATGIVAHPVGGVLDLVTTTARGWMPSETSAATLMASGDFANTDAQATQAGRWLLRREPDVSPLKFYLQCCQGLPPPGTSPALLFWSLRCELVRVDGADGQSGGGGEPNLRLVRAGLLLTTAQVCVLADEGTAHVLDIGAVQAVEEARGRPSTLVTISSTAGGIWQLHVREEPGEFVAHLRRARRLLEVPHTSAARCARTLA